MKKSLLIFAFVAAFVGAAFGQTEKDTVTVLQDSEISLGTWDDTLKTYFIQSGVWKKGTVSGLISFLEGYGIRAEGRVSQIATISDTSTITTPFEGDIALTTGGDTLAVRHAASGWLLFYGGGGGGGGTMSSFTLAGTSGTPQTVADGQTATIAAGSGITTTAGATRTVTVAADTFSISTRRYVDSLHTADGDKSATNEIQTLSLTDSTNRNYTLALSGGGSVQFNATDPDTLSFSSPNLSISGGNSVSLAGLLSGYPTGSGAANQVAYWSGTSALTSSPNFQFDGTTITRAGTITATSGTTSLNTFSATFAPTSGTGVFNGLTMSNTINQTGGANGVTRAIYVNPTITAAADYRAIETSNNTGLAFFAAGTANSRFNGSVGIGTAPSYALDISSTGGMRIPVGTEAQRPTGATGVMRYNTTDNSAEIYHNAAWKSLVTTTLANGRFTSTYVPYADANGDLTGSSFLSTNGSSSLTISGSGNTNIYVGAGGAGHRMYYDAIGSNGGLLWMFGSSLKFIVGSSGGFILLPNASDQTTGAALLISTGAGGYNRSNPIISITKPVSFAGGEAIYSIDVNPATTTLDALNNHSGAIAGGIRINNVLTTTGGTLGQRKVIFRGATITPTITRDVNSDTLSVGIFINPALNSTTQWRSIETQNNVGWAFYASGSATNAFAGSTIFGATTTPSRTLHVTGEARITDLVTDVPVYVVGADADGDLGRLVLSGASITSGGGVDTLKIAGSADGNGIYSGSGSLTGDVTVTGGSYNTLWNGNKNFGVTVQVNHSGANGTAFAADGSSGGATAISANAASGFGISSNSTGSYALYATSGGGTSAYFLGETSNTNAVLNVLEVSRRTSGTSANGLGGGIRFLLETSTGVETHAGDIQVLWTNATNASQSSAMDFYTINSASAGRKMRIGPDGQITADTYGDGTFVGTVTTTPAFTSAGLMLEQKDTVIYFDDTDVDLTTTLATNPGRFKRITLLGSVANVGPASNATLTIPAPDAAYLNIEFVVIANDANGTYNVEITAGANEIADGDGTYSTTYTMTANQRVRITSLNDPLVSGYRWFIQ